MRDYQCKNRNPYYLPKSLHKRILSVIRDYDREKNEICNIVYSSAKFDTEPCTVNRPTEIAAVILAQYESDLEAVKNALMKIPEEYRFEVFDNIRYETKFPDIASYRTWIRWRQRFIYETAKNLNLI